MARTWIRKSRKGDKFVVTLGGVKLLEIQMKSVGEFKAQMCFLRDDKIRVEHIQAPKTAKRAP